MKSNVFKGILTLIAVALIAIYFVYDSYNSESPIDKKYRKINQELFTKFDAARNILTSYSGKKEDLKKAHTLLAEVINNDNRFAPAYREYGRLIIMAGNLHDFKFISGSLESSEKLILASIEIEPNYADSYVLLGHLYKLMNQFDKAETALTKAEQIGTNSPWLHINWADLLEGQKQYEEAIERYETLLKKEKLTDRMYLTALQGMRNIYIKTGDYDKAKPIYLKQIDRAPDNAHDWGNYGGFLLFRYNDTDGAIQNLRKALSLMDYNSARFVLACALYTKWAKLLDNDQESSQVYYDEAFLLCPELERVIKQTNKFPPTNITAVKLKEKMSQ